MRGIEFCRGGMPVHGEGTEGTVCCREGSGLWPVMVVPLRIEATDDSDVMRRSPKGLLTCRWFVEERSGFELDLPGLLA